MLVKAIGMSLQVREREVCRSVYVCKYIEAVPRDIRQTPNSYIGESLKEVGYYFKSIESI